MNELHLAKAARFGALLIALLAVIDPAITSERASRPDISVIAASPADSALATQVASQLAGSFTVLREPFVAAAATVVAGSQVPAAARESNGPTFAVLPNALGSRVLLKAINGPSRAAVDARVAVASTIDVRGGRGKQLELTLSANGAVVDRVTREIQSDTVRADVPLSFVPTAPGAVTLQVAARFAGEAKHATADMVVDVRNQKWAVLFFDPRPSWMSTFVRRAVERDPRFAVTSRVVTSSNVSTDAGKPPASLFDPAIMELYDAIVVGAPESLGERDVAGLERFLRRRGGSLVLLFDGNRRGAYERLASIGAFANTSNSAGTVVSGAGTDSVAMRATEWMWPVQLPAGAEVFASSSGQSASAVKHPLVWSTPAGAGRVIVSGALDAWKFRDVAQSGFEKFWQEAIAHAAQASAESVELRMSNVPVEPGAAVKFQLTSRSATLTEATSAGSTRSTAAVDLETPNGKSMVRVWPTAIPGEFAGIVNAPIEPGTYRITAHADGATTSMPLVVSANATGGNAEESDVLAAWVAANGGEVIPASRMNELPALLQRKVTAVERRVVWHPMRSAWWMVPFALGLGAEWWVRRRRGKA